VRRARPGTLGGPVITGGRHQTERGPGSVQEQAGGARGARDTYGVAVAPGENDVLILAIVAVIDTMAHPDR
jgi:hypothetical protein